MNALGRRIVVAAFDGWSDAAEAATAALRRLGEASAYVPVFDVDPELYFDYQYTRPVLRADGDGVRRLHWPQASLRRPEPTTRGTQLWLLGGAEPARAWKSFTGELTDVFLREDVTGLVVLGSMMSDVPHTRPISVSVASENDGVQSALGVDRGAYEGPVGVLSALTEAAEGVGIPTVGLWAQVPHYVSGQTPSPKATLALLERLEEVCQMPMPRGDLPTQARIWEATVDAAAAEDEDMAEYIRQLEAARDTWDSPAASGEAIAEEFEQYLRRSGDGRGEGPR